MPVSEGPNSTRHDLEALRARLRAETDHLCAERGRLDAAVAQARLALEEVEASAALTQRLSRTGSWTWYPADPSLGEWSPEVYTMLGYRVGEVEASFSSNVARIGGADLEALDMYLLRSQVLVLDRPTIAEVTIRQYLSLAASDVSAVRMQEALAAVGLQQRIARLPEGLDTPLASTGYPLGLGAMMALKLANALLVAPRLLMLGQLYDLLPPGRLASVLRMLKARGTTTLLFSGRPEDLALDGWFHLGSRHQQRFATLRDLQDHLAHGEEADALSS